MLRFIEFVQDLMAQKRNIDRLLFDQPLHDPITPNHKRPKSLDDEQFSPLASDADKELFAALTGFADRINWIYEDEPWRLQESAETDPMLRSTDGRSAGSVYEIFYNRREVGRLEIGVDLLTEGATCVAIRIDGVRLLPFRRVSDLIHTICKYVCDGDNSILRSEINEAMVEALWEPDVSMIGSIDLDFYRSGGGYENWMSDRDQ